MAQEFVSWLLSEGFVKRLPQAVEIGQILLDNDLISFVASNKTNVRGIIFFIADEHEPWVCCALPDTETNREMAHTRTHAHTHTHTHAHAHAPLHRHLRLTTRATACHRACLHWTAALVRRGARWTTSTAQTRTGSKTLRSARRCLCWTTSSVARLRRSLLLTQTSKCAFPLPRFFFLFHAGASPHV